MNFIGSFTTFYLKKRINLFKNYTIQLARFLG